MRRYDDFKQRDRISFVLNLLCVFCASLLLFAEVGILLDWQYGEWLLIADGILFGLLELIVAVKGWDEFYQLGRFLAGTYQIRHRRLLISGCFHMIVGAGALVLKVVV